MKAQKLGLVLGMNMAVACLVLQGCKATRTGTDAQPPVVEPIVEPAPGAVDPAPTTTTTVTTITAEPEPVVVEPQPSKVTVVKPLPPPAPKPVLKPVAATTPVTAEGFVYVVKPGDQLFAVSRRYNVKLSAIERANPGLNPNRIRVGQKIKIPGVTGPAVVAEKAASAKSAKVVPAAAPAPTAANTVAPVKTKTAFNVYTGPTREYKVRSGDSLGKIAYENGITIRALKDMNKLTKDSLRVGQTLLIPAEKVNAAKKPVVDKPVVKPVEKKVEAPKPVEKKDAAVPAPAPTSAPAPVVAPAKPEVPAAPAAVTPPPEQKPVVEVTMEGASESVTPVTPAAATYVAKEGDDIVSVAIAWGISPSQLMDLNDLKAGDSIKPGQVLKLPANAKQAVQ